MLPEQQRKQLAATLKKMEQAWEKPETIKLFVSAFNKKYSGTTPQPEKSAFMQMAWDVKSGAKALVWDIKANLTGTQQKPEEQGLLNRTVWRFKQAGADIASALKWTKLSDIPWVFNPMILSEQKKKLFTAVSKPFSWTMGDVATSGIKTLATDERVQDVKNFIQSEPVQWTAEKVKKLADIVVPNQTDQEFLLELSNWIPVPIIDDILSGAFRGAKYVPEPWIKIRWGVSPEWALPLSEGIRTGAENLTSGILESVKTAGKWIVNTAAENVLSLANPDWRIGKVATREVRKATGKSPVQYGLENGVIDADSAKNLHYSNIQKKIELVKDFGQTKKDTFSTSMAESLLKQIDDISKEMKITNPEIIKARENLERFINTENPTFAQKDAIKSLYDLQNPDNLKWDIKWKPESAPKHQEAAFRRWEVQKEIEARGKELGIDVEKINKDIQASYALEKWLRNRAEVLDANTGIGWQDSQLWVLASLAGGLDAGTGAILFKKLLLDNSSFRWQLAKKMYIWANENRTLTSWAGNPASNRASRLVNTIGDNPAGNVTVPINGKTGVWLAKTFERWYTLKDWQIDKPFGIKEALEDFKKLPLQEQAAAVSESPALAKVVEIDEIMTTLPKGLFGAKVPPQDIVASLRPITEKIINKEYSPQELDFISESAPKEAQMELRRAYEKTRLTWYKTDTEMAGMPEKTPEDVLQGELKEITRLAVRPTWWKSVAVSDAFYRDFVSGKKDMNEIFNIMDANDANPDVLAQKNIVDGFNKFMRRLNDEKITVSDNGTADLSRKQMIDQSIKTTGEYKNPDKPDKKDALDFKSKEELERNYLVKKWLTKRQAENAIREFNAWVDDPELLAWKIEMLEKSLKNNGKSPDEIKTIVDDYVNDMNAQGLDEWVIGSKEELKSLEEQSQGIEMRNPEESPAPEDFIKGKEKFRTAVDAQRAQLTTKILKGLGDRETVSKEFIMNMTNQGEIKQIEKDIIRELLKWEGEKVNVADFKKKVQAELLPLKIQKVEAGLWDINDDTGEWMSGRYEWVTLPKETRGEVMDYREHIYESPIATTAWDVHFNGDTENYFGHTRIEDMAPSPYESANTVTGKRDGTIRRVIEVQSDLYQKGRLDSEFERAGRIDGSMANKELSVENAENTLRRLNEDLQKFKEGKRGSQLSDDSFFYDSESDFTSRIDKWNKLLQEAKSGKVEVRKSELSKLQQYNDPTAHFRMVREEVAKAAQDGKTKLQFPTGETAMKIEGLGSDNHNWIVSDIDKSWNRSGGNKLTTEKIERWMTIDKWNNEDEHWIVTDVLSDGRFKAVPKRYIDRALASSDVDSQSLSVQDQISYLENHKPEAFDRSETFDISGKVDSNNPIYKFYEKEMGRYLKNKYNAKLVTDDKWVNWYEVEVKPEMGGDVEAFRTLGDKMGATITPEKIKEIQSLNTKLFWDDNVDIVPQILSNKDALGSYKDGMIKILDGQAEPSDTYMHEAVHKYLDAFTSEAEHLDILEYGKKKYGLDDFVEVEEKIAEDFIKYAKNRKGFTGTLKLHFENLINRIKAFFGSAEKIDLLYNDLMRGKAKGKSRKVKDNGLEKYNKK